MEKLTILQTLQRLCLSTGKWGMYISMSHTESVVDDIPKAAPYLNFREDGQLIQDSEGILLFDSREEMERTYGLTVGDDGPTELNRYNGPCSIYALTCDPEGTFLNENT